MDSREKFKQGYDLAPTPLLASRWGRFLAFLIDGLLHLPIWWIYIALFQTAFSADDIESDPLASWDVTTLVLAYFWSFGITAVQWYFLTKDGQSIGKKVLKIRIVKHDTLENGGFVKNVLIRTLLINLLGSVFCAGQIFSIVDCLYIFREDRRCLHDHIAGTIVIEGLQQFCPNCSQVLRTSSDICPKCGQVLSASTRRLASEGIENLLSRLDRNRLALPPESYFSNAQIYAQNRQMEKAALELAKVLVVASPTSEIHRRAEKLLRGMGYRFEV